LNVGKKENLTPLRLIGIINNALDSGNVEIGKIEILKSFSFFEIEDSAVVELTTAIKNHRFKGRNLSVEVAHDKSNAYDKKNRSKKRTMSGRNSRRFGR
jgi:ATP-dependent RNA helicase DeaD